MPARAAVDRWRNFEPVEMRAPMPAEVLLALAAAAMAVEWPRTAACLLLAFHVLLRPSEVATALKQHLNILGELGGDFNAVVLMLLSAKRQTEGRSSRAS